jgi:hypothetical protein
MSRAEKARKINGDQLPLTFGVWNIFSRAGDGDRDHATDHDHRPIMLEKYRAFPG